MRHHVLTIREMTGSYTGPGGWTALRGRRDSGAPGGEVVCPCPPCVWLPFSVPVGGPRSSWKTSSCAAGSAVVAPSILKSSSCRPSPSTPNRCCVSRGGIRRIRPMPRTPTSARWRSSSGRRTGSIRRTVHNWLLHVVVKREAWAVAEQRSRLVGVEAELDVLDDGRCTVSVEERTEIRGPRAGGRGAQAPQAAGAHRAGATGAGALVPGDRRAQFVDLYEGETPAGQSRRAWEQAAPSSGAKCPFRVVGPALRSPPPR